MILSLLLTFQLKTVSSVYTSPWDLKKGLCSNLVFPLWNACLKAAKHFTAAKTSNSWINLNLFWALPLLAVCSEIQPVNWIPQFSSFQNKSDITCLMGVSQGYRSGPKLQGTVEELQVCVLQEAKIVIFLGLQAIPWIKVLCAILKWKMLHKKVIIMRFCLKALKSSYFFWIEVVMRF